MEHRGRYSPILDLGLGAKRKSPVENRIPPPIHPVHSVHLFSPHAHPGRRFLIALALWAGMAFQGCMERNVTLTIDKTGTCEMVTEIVMPRDTMVHYLRYGSKRDQKPATDEALADAVQALFGERERLFQLHGAEVTSVQVQKDTVRVVVNNVYDTLDEMVGSAGTVLAGSGFGKIVLDTDEKGNLRIAFSCPKDSLPYAKAVAKRVQQSLFRGTFKIVMPGKVLTSALPNTKDNATWIVVEPKKPEDLDALAKLFESSVVVTSEMGGLVLDVSLDSETQPSYNEKQTLPELPITDAGPGFEVEALRTKVTTVYPFPGVDKYLKAEALPSREEGLVIDAQLVAPRGRLALSVGRPRVIKALDDKRRPVPLQAGQRADPDGRYPDGLAEPHETASFQLLLKPPQPDAMAVEELTGEVEATTFCGWKEHVVADAKADPKNEIDLSDVLPGAKMVITKASDARRAELGAAHGEFTIEVTGSPMVRYLNFEVRMTAARRIHRGVSSTDLRKRKGQTVLTLSLNYFEERWSERAGAEDKERATESKPALVVRYPQDLRRERVKFTLHALDLF